MRRIGLLLAAVLLGLLAAGCEPAARTPSPEPGAEVVIASFNFPESRLLAEIYAQALEAARIPVRRELDLGPRELVLPALREHFVDLVPEYLGTALASVAPRGTPVTAAALRSALAPLRLTALTPSAAADQNGFAVTAATARRLDLHTLGDLAGVAPGLTLGGPTECPRRPYCAPGLDRLYGIRFRSFAAYDDARQRATALDEGVIDVAVTFTTAGELATGRLRLLTDDRGLQPAENVVPVVSERALHRYPRLGSVLDAVSAQLSSAALRFLNWRIDAGRDPVAEAAGWLRRHGLA